MNRARFVYKCRLDDGIDILNYAILRASQSRNLFIAYIESLDNTVFALLFSRCSAVYMVQKLLYFRRFRNFGDNFIISNEFDSLDGELIQRIVHCQNEHVVFYHIGNNAVLKADISRNHRKQSPINLLRVEVDTFEIALLAYDIGYGLLIDQVQLDEYLANLSALFLLNPKSLLKLFNVQVVRIYKYLAQTFSVHSCSYQARAIILYR